MVLVALMIITLQRGAGSLVDFDVTDKKFYFSILFALICACFWGMVSLLAKFANYKFGANPEEYSMV